MKFHLLQLYSGGLKNLEEVEIIFWMQNTQEDHCQL